MAMSDKDFSAIEAATDSLLSSGLNAEQLKYANQVIRVAYRHIHKSNNQVFESKQIAEGAVNAMYKLELSVTPAIEGIQ